MFLTVLLVWSVLIFQGADKVLDAESARLIFNKNLGKYKWV